RLDLQRELLREEVELILTALLAEKAGPAPREEGAASLRVIVAAVSEREALDRPSGHIDELVRRDRDSGIVHGRRCCALTTETDLASHDEPLARHRSVVL